jgi:hypothetical protein
MVWIINVPQLCGLKVWSPACGAMGGGTTFRCEAYWEEVTSLEAFEEDTGLQATSLLLLHSHHEIRSFAQPHTLYHSVLPCHRPNTRETAEHGLRLL